MTLKPLVACSALLLATLITRAPHASQGAPPQPADVQEFYVAVTCEGLTTPVATTPVYTPLLTAYFFVPPGQPYPSIFDLRRQTPARFTFLSQECNRLRYLHTPAFTTGGGTIVPSWSNDRKYQRIVLGERIVTTIGQCRPLGEACRSDANCCSGVCSEDTGACEP